MNTLIKANLCPILFLLFYVANAQQIRLYPVWETDDKVGYINRAGKQVIESKFEVGHPFSEHLAVVRHRGRYGFINPKGSFVIQPKFDYAHSFQNGIAKVYMDGKPYFIDKSGQYLFEHQFVAIDDFDENGFAKVHTKSNPNHHENKLGLINRKGDLVLDTLFESISDLQDGLAVVKQGGSIIHSSGARMKKIGLVNTAGEFIVPFGMYYDIQPFKNGFFKVDIIDSLGSAMIWTNDGIIDANGKLRFSADHEKWAFDYGTKGFSEGLATIRLELPKPGSVKYWSPSDYTYKGVVDTNGIVQFSNKNWGEITPFRHGLAFVEVNGSYRMIDERGDIVSEEKMYPLLKNRNYATLKRDYFADSILLIRDSDGFLKAVNASGEIMNLFPEEFEDDFEARVGNFVITGGYYCGESRKECYGLFDLKTRRYIEAKYHQIQAPNTRDDLILVCHEDRMGYIDWDGNYVWSATEKESKRSYYENIDFMIRGRYYAHSPKKKALAGAGGWGRSTNKYKSLDSLSLDASGFSLILSDRQEDLFDGIGGRNIYLVNAANDTVYFEAQDSRLYMMMQAKDRFGAWKDIEYLPSSWCGNSYHKVFLPPHHYWSFATLAFDKGAMKTDLRVRLWYKEHYSDSREEEKTIYSNEVKGRVNPAQFWRKKRYASTNLMDAYNN